MHPPVSPLPNPCQSDRPAQLTEKENVASQIRIGTPRWTCLPWRGDLYPKGLPQRRELEYAARQVNSIEINGIPQGTRLITPAPPAGKQRDDFIHFDNDVKNRSPFDAISLGKRFSPKPDDGMEF